jgi:hypothetical protein
MSPHFFLHLQNQIGENEIVDHKRFLDAYDLFLKEIESQVNRNSDISKDKFIRKFIKRL